MPHIDVACQLIEVPVKAPGDGPTVLTDGALQRTGYHDASGVRSIGCPVLYRLARIEGGSRRMPWSLSQPANGHARLGHVNIRMVASSPCQVREQDAQDSSSGFRADGSHRFVSGEGGGRL